MENLKPAVVHLIASSDSSSTLSSKMMFLLSEVVSNLLLGVNGVAPAKEFVTKVLFDQNADALYVQMRQLLSPDALAKVSLLLIHIILFGRNMTLVDLVSDSLVVLNWRRFFDQIGADSVGAALQQLRTAFERLFDSFPLSVSIAELLGVNQIAMELAYDLNFLKFLPLDKSKHASLLAQRGQLARSSCQRLLKKYTGDALFWRMYAMVEAELGDWDASLTILTRALAKFIDPQLLLEAVELSFRHKQPLSAQTQLLSQFSRALTSIRLPQAANPTEELYLVARVLMKALDLDIESFDSLNFGPSRFNNLFSSPTSSSSFKASLHSNPFAYLVVYTTFSFLLNGNSFPHGVQAITRVFEIGLSRMETAANAAILSFHFISFCSCEQASLAGPDLVEQLKTKAAGLVRVTSDLERKEEKAAQQEFGFFSELAEFKGLKPFLWSGAAINVLIGQLLPAVVFSESDSIHFILESLESSPSIELRVVLLSSLLRRLRAAVPPQSYFLEKLFRDVVTRTVVALERSFFLDHGPLALHLGLVSTYWSKSLKTLLAALQSLSIKFPSSSEIESLLAAIKESLEIEHFLRLQ